MAFVNAFGVPLIVIAVWIGELGLGAPEIVENLTLVVGGPAVACFGIGVNDLLAALFRRGSNSRK